MKVIIVGMGQLGKMVASYLKSYNFRVIGFSHRDVDIIKKEDLKKIINYGGDVLINTAAMTNVDQCETNPLKAIKVNAIGSKNVAEIANIIKAKYIYISTDFVFDGKKNTPYSEKDAPNPINIYGESKYIGELLPWLNTNKVYTLRIASLYGPNKSRNKEIGNFVDFVVEKINKGEPICAIDDVYMSPTYTYDVAEIIAKIIDSDLEYGIYHTNNTGGCSWYELAKYIGTKLGKPELVKRIKSDELKRIAKRPKYTVMDNTKIQRKLSIKIRGWEKAVTDYLESYMKNQIRAG